MQSIKEYIDRYPGTNWKDPMIDQINMRLLPKLAGAELTDCADSLTDLIKICEDHLGAIEFANALKDAAAKNQIFEWSGYTYENGRT